jgi:NAD-reducing hydrogenase small subunit
MDRLKLATVWLGGCSGCHMSFLDLDEWLIELARMADVVYSPILDVKEYPHGVDAVLVEGAVTNEDNLALIRQVRERTRLVVSFGDCAVTGNVTALRNPIGPPAALLEHVYGRANGGAGRVPDAPDLLPALLPRAVPVHDVIAVDAYMPGCPPPATRIREVLQQLLAGQVPRLGGAEIAFG